MQAGAVAELADGEGAGLLGVGTREEVVLDEVLPFGAVVVTVLLQRVVVLYQRERERQRGARGRWLVGVMVEGQGLVSVFSEVTVEGLMWLSIV